METATATTAPRLDEQALRKPAFTGGVPVRLADGQTWTLAQPRVSHHGFSRDAAGKTRMRNCYTFGEGFTGMVNAFIDSDEYMAEAIALFDLAFDLLSRNYNVTAADASTLLYRSRPDATGPEAESNRAVWLAIADIVLGRTPATEPATAPTA